MHAFTKWSASNDVETSFVEIRQTEHAGKGLFTRRALRCGESAVTIPSNLLATSERVLQTSPRLQQVIKRLEEKNGKQQAGATLLSIESERMVLRLFLLVEMFAPDSQSFWKPYIDILPTLDEIRKYHLLFNTEEAALKYTGIGKAVLAKRAALEREFGTLQLWELGGSFSSLSLDMWIWADVTFWSRVVSLKSSQEDGCDDSEKEKKKKIGADMVLVPFFDLANHSLSPNIRWQLTADGAMQLVTTRDVDDGDELFLSYGNKSNQELLFLHGFTVQNNPEPICFTLPLRGFLNQCDPDDLNKYAWLVERTKPVLKLYGESQGNFPEAHAAFAATGWSFESIAVMYLLAMDNDDGLEFERLPNIEALSLQPDKGKSRAVNEDVKIKILGDNVTTLDDLAEQVVKCPNFAVIQLRTVILLLEAISSHRDQQSYTEIEPSYPEAAYMEHLRRYMQEESQLLDRAIESLASLRDTLFQHETVQAYLSQQTED